MPHDYRVFSVDYAALASCYPDFFGKVSAAAVWQYLNPRMSHATASMFTFCYAIPGRLKYLCDLVRILVDTRLINGFEKNSRAAIEDRVQSVKKRSTKKADKESQLEDLNLGVDELVPVDDEASEVDDPKDRLLD